MILGITSRAKSETMAMRIMGFMSRALGETVMVC